jgi:hypothetical protein
MCFTVFADFVCASTSDVFYDSLASRLDAGVHYIFSIFGRDSWGNAVDQSIMKHPASFLVALCSPALLDGCLRFVAIQNASGYAEVSFALSQSGAYSVSVQALAGRLILMLMCFCSSSSHQSLLNRWTECKCFRY